MILKSPIIKKIKDNPNSLSNYKLEINDCVDKNEKKLINDYPTVYIHIWKKGKGYEAYVGESNDIFKRTIQHYKNSKLKEYWQHNLKLKNSILYIIGHEHFNKSLTLDIENKLRQYLISVDSVKRVYNKRENPQHQYYTSTEFDKIFHDLWKKLHHDNKELFPLESNIMDSAIFMASPFHKLTIEQQKAKELIINRVIELILSKKSKQLIFIEGESGTGKTVLNSSTFYELCCINEELNDGLISNRNPIKCCLIVNHKEHIKVYKQILKKLCIDNTIVYSPTSFIHKYNDDNCIDVAFVDEAHLLLTQGRQSYAGKNQLKDIMERAKITIVMFDVNQILRAEQYWESYQLEDLKRQAKKQKNYIILKEQLRMRANKKVLEWIDKFTKEGIVNQFPNDMGNYDIKIFDTPILLEKAIKKKALSKDTRLSRLIATYDWEYKKNIDNNGKLWEVMIDDWHMPWNYEFEKNFSRIEKKKIQNLTWIEKEHTINEIGSTYSIQGFDLNYVGLIIGPSVKYRNNKIVFSPSDSCNTKATMNKKLSTGKYKNFSEQLLKNELRVLMTRGVNGLYIYAYDEALRNHLKECSKGMYIDK